MYNLVGSLNETWNLLECAGDRNLLDWIAFIEKDSLDRMNNGSISLILR